MKTRFQLEEEQQDEITRPHGGQISIIKKCFSYPVPYVAIKIYDIDKNDKYNHRNLFIPDKDLERFAVNILKALGSKKLK